ncbi:MAG: hypothetical protein OEQ12_04730 [Nitrosopumilus sp.]|nr:hypothetical protein [Nitrosopumilus sp.]
MKTNDQIYYDEESTPRELEFLLGDPSNILSRFGLSPNQSKVFLYLSKWGPKHAAHLSKKLDIPRTEVYHLVKILQRKGCISSINEKPMKYSVVCIENFLEKMIIFEKNKIKKKEETLFAIKNLNLANNIVASRQ